MTPVMVTNQYTAHAWCTCGQGLSLPTRHHHATVHNRLFKFNPTLGFDDLTNGHTSAALCVRLLLRLILPFPPILSHIHAPLLLFILQNPTAWYYCHANLRCLSPQTQSYLFTQTQARLTLGTLREREREKADMKDPQTPQMRFQSVLIYLSPWGLLSVVICLCLGWHNLCPSCFKLCIQSLQDNP